MAHSKISINTSNIGKLKVILKNHLTCIIIPSVSNKKNLWEN